MKIFIALFVAFTIVRGATVEESVRERRQAYIWNARACDNGKKLCEKVKIFGVNLSDGIFT